MKVSFKYVLFVGLCLILASFASFQIQSTDIWIYVDGEGGANINEEFVIYIEGTESISLYEESLITLDRNNLQGWYSKLQLSDLIYHVGGQNVEVENLAILPEPVQKIYNHGYAKISINYNIAPPKTIFDGEKTIHSGLFKIETIKPRTKQYLLNSNAFLNINSNGDLILSSNTKLNFLLPENSKITGVYPTPDNLRNELPPFYINSIYWNKPVLPKYNLEFEIEDTLEQEIVDFFNSIQNNINEKIKGPEGVPILIIFIVIIISIFYIHKINKRDK